jgi:tellurite resistance protein
MAKNPTPLKFLAPGWYAIVMGLAGLSLAWQRATPFMGAQANVVAWALGGLAVLVFAVLAFFTVIRGQRHPEAWAEDRRHPVRHTLIAALPIAMLLLATVAVALNGVSEPARWLWWMGSLSQLYVSIWVVSRWWLNPQAGGLGWASVTPALLIPIVGNVVAPLAGVALGHTEWAAAQCGIGLLFWPVILTLLVIRVATQGLWPERLMPTLFILIAPPAVGGVALLQLGAPSLVGWAFWGIAIFSFVWIATQLPRITGLPFSPMHWAMSFPMTALTALTLALATPGSAMGLLGITLLSMTSLIILSLITATVRGLREGTLLAPEQIAVIQATS